MSRAKRRRKRPLPKTSRKAAAGKRRSRVASSDGGRAPALVVDSRGKVVDAVGNATALLGLSAKPDSTLAAAFGLHQLPTKLRQALRTKAGEVRVTARRPDGCRVVVDLRIADAGTRGVSVGLHRVHAPRDVDHTAPVLYEVGSDARGFGTLRSVTNFHRRSRTRGVRCYEQLAGSDAPCPGCPALTLMEQKSLKRASAVLETDDLPYGVATAERTATRVFRVAVMPIHDATLSELIQARIATLSRMAGLSERERDVLELILLNRGLEEMGSVLGITVRTVRFHVANILSKLGADSRADLLRLLL